MDGAAARIDERASVIRAHMQETNKAIGEVLALAREIDPADEAAVTALLRVAEAVGSSGQANQGQMTLILAQANRLKADRKGLVLWITKHLDVTPGAARGIALSVREIGYVSELAGPLVSGWIGASTIRALTRTACAVKETDQDLSEALIETLRVAANEGVSAANRHVRLLERTIAEAEGPGKPAGKRRARGFLRMFGAEDGSRRINGRLDPRQAQVFKTALDQIVSTCLRSDRSGHPRLPPEGVESTEQLHAQALAHMAEAYSAAETPQRSSLLDLGAGTGLTRSSCGLLVPDRTLASTGSAAADLLDGAAGIPLPADGGVAGQDPASPPTASEGPAKSDIRPFAPGLDQDPCRCLSRMSARLSGRMAVG